MMTMNNKKISKTCPGPEGCNERQVSHRERLAFIHSVGGESGMIPRTSISIDCSLHVTVSLNSLDECRTQ